MRLNPWITSVEEEGAFAVLDKALALKAQGKPVLNLGIGQPDFLPPEHVIAAAEQAVREGPHGYTSPVGIAALREAVAEHVGSRYAVDVDPGQVVIVPGGKVTFYFACLLFGGPGAEILYPDPGFPPYREAIRSGGAAGVAYPIREDHDFGFDAEEVLALVNGRTRLIIINSPANPTGGVVARAELQKLVDGLQRFPETAVLSDEIYSHLIYRGSDFVSLMQFPEILDRLILLDGWSKTFAMTGWRLGYGIWPPALVEHVRKLITIDHSCVNVAAQMAGLAALTGPMDEVIAFRDDLARRRDLVVDGLNRVPGFSCREPGGAFYAFPNVAGTGIASRKLAQRLLEEAYVALIPGDSFGANGAGYLRVSYAASTEVLEEAFARIRQLVGEASLKAM